MNSSDGTPKISATSFRDGQIPAAGFVPDVVTQAGDAGRLAEPRLAFTQLLLILSSCGRVSRKPGINLDQRGQTIFDVSVEDRVLPVWGLAHLSPSFALLEIKSLMDRSS